MDREQFYQRHWIEIEDDRLSRYEQMFEWRPEQERLLAPLSLSRGLDVLDFGCGPGFLAMEIASRVGETGRVIGVDLNRQFIERATRRAVAAGLSHLEYRHVEGDRLPLDDASFERVICKNVLEYVPDAAATLGELRRIMRPGALIEVVDSDWGFVIVEPWGKDRVETFFRAAAYAFREPFIGRRISGLLNRAGFSDIDITVSPFVDRQGRGLPILTNMVSYIRTFDSLSAGKVEAMMDELDSAIESGDYLFVLPQFVVTAVKPR